MEKLEMLQELYAEDLEQFNSKTGLAKINGQYAYILDPKRELTMRHELVAALASAGMKPADIARQLKTNPEKTDSGHYSRLLRDPRIRALARGKAADVLEVAQAKLRNAVVQSAENIASAVKAGDLKMSQYVLGTQGVTDKPVAASNGNVTINFGDWLSSYENTKDIHTIPAEAEVVEIETDATNLPAIPLDGERL